jgi:hypothetical protein
MLIKRFLPVLLAALIAIAPIAQATPISGNSVTVTSVTPGTTTTKLGKTEDAAHASGDVGVLGLGVVTTDGDGTSATDGDNAAYTLSSTGAVRVQSVGTANEGLSVYSNIDIDETSGTTTQQLKSSKGVLYSCVVGTTTGTAEYLKFYNATSLTGSAAGTETPVITVALPALLGNQTLYFGPGGYYFDTGMTLAATTGIAVADTGAPAANAVYVNCFYK